MAVGQSGLHLPHIGLPEGSERRLYPASPAFLASGAAAFPASPPSSSSAANRIVSPLGQAGLRTRFLSRDWPGGESASGSNHVLEKKKNI